MVNATAQNEGGMMANAGEKNFLPGSSAAVRARGCILDKRMIRYEFARCRRGASRIAQVSPL